MGTTIDEGILFDLMTKRRAGRFTADELLWAADHPEVMRFVAANLSIVEDLMRRARPTALPTTYDQSLGLTELIELAVGKRNLGNINPDITPERFPLTGTDVRTVNLRVEPFKDNETGEDAAKRLTSAGHVLANTGDLAGFLHDHPKEVEKWAWVVALSEDSRWTNPDGRVLVPCARVYGARRGFVLDCFRGRFSSVGSILVRCE